MVKKSNLVTATVMMVLASSVCSAETVVSRAQVLISEPVGNGSYVEYISKPVNVCTLEKVPVYGRNKDNVGAFLGGAVIGGIIGNAIDSSGGAGIGAIIGGAIANENQKNHSNTVVAYEHVRTCRTEYQLVEQPTRINQCRTVVEFPDLGRYRTEFTGYNCYRVGEYINLEVNLDLTSH